MWAIARPAPPTVAGSDPRRVPRRTSTADHERGAPGLTAPTTVPVSGVPAPQRPAGWCILRAPSAPAGGGARM
jgi:hypothetical protein